MNEAVPRERVAIGVVGAGKIAERHVLAYKQLGVTDLYLFDVDPVVRAARSTEWQVEAVDDLDTLLGLPGIAAVDVCTPTSFHAPYAIRALEARKHVFCEKPLCLSTREGKEIEAAATAACRIVMVGYLYRFHPAFQFVKSLLEERTIGDPYLALVRLGGRGSAAAWKHTVGQGAGAMGEMMAHMIDLATWYFGSIDEVDPLWNATLLPSREIGSEVVPASAEDISIVRLRAGEVQILVESDLATPSYMQHIDIQGSNGSIFSSILHYLPTVVYCKEQRGIYGAGNSVYTFQQENLFVDELGYFLDAIAGAPHTVNLLQDSMHIVEVLERIQGMTASHYPPSEAVH